MSNPENHRHIVLHYHLFKNAGTSLDKILKENFKEGWYEHEGPSSGWKSSDVSSYIEENRHIKVLSSHTALLPVPDLPNTTIYPVIFMRHPIDRIRSIYEFEHQQIAETEGAIKAKELDLAGYIEWRLSRKGDRTIRNFHAYRLAFAAPPSLVEKETSEEERALFALKTLPFIGCVERFNESLNTLERWIKPAFPKITFKPTKINVTQTEGTLLEDRVESLKKIIGNKLYSDLVHHNQFDLNLYDYLLAKFSI